MPIAVSVNELRPGMELARAIRNQYSTLVTVGTRLNDRQIHRVRQLGYDQPVLIVDPLLDSKVAFEDDSREQDMGAQVHREMVQALGKVEEAFRRSTNLKPADFVGLQQTLADTIREIEECPIKSAFLLKAQSKDEYLKAHSANVFYLSMLMGKELRDYIYRERMRQTSADKLHRPMDLAPLGAGALLHDIGMLPLLSVMRKPGRLSHDEVGRVRTHPVEGAVQIPETYVPAVRTIVRQHHECADGSGYPAGRTAGNTHVFARIVRVADAFDAATSTTMYRDAKLPCKALYEMTHGPWRGQFDRTLIKVFLSVVQPFPIGARVRLSTGEHAVVVKHNARQPFAPVVIVAFDRNGRRLTAEKLRPPIDLRSAGVLRLDAYRGSQLGYIYRTNGSLGVRRPASQAGTAFELAYP